MQTWQQAIVWSQFRDHLLAVWMEKRRGQGWHRRCGGGLCNQRGAPFLSNIGSAIAPCSSAVESLFLDRFVFGRLPISFIRAANYNGRNRYVLHHLLLMGNPDWPNGDGRHFIRKCLEAV